MSVPHIVWSEGMFIAPQHFQQQERALRAYADAVAQLDLDHGDHGLSELQVDGDLLAVGKVAVTAAAGVMPDRTHFRLSRAIDIDIPDGTVDRLLHLVLPLSRRGVLDYGAEGENRRYVRRDMELNDANDADNPAIEAQVAETGVRLILQGTDMAGLVHLPVARILEKRSDGAVVLDRTFLPRALCLAAAPVLAERLREVAAQARAGATATAARLAANRAVQSSGSLLSEQLELLVLNRSTAAIEAMLAAPRTSPRRIHAALVGLSAELDALAARPLQAEAGFEPERAQAQFQTLFARLREQLTLSKPDSVLTLDWDDDLFAKRRLLRLAIPKALWPERRRPILAVSAQGAGERLGETVPPAAKLSGLTRIADLVRRGLPGVTLTHLPVPPAELRAQPDAAFFAVETGHPEWRRLEESRESLALHVDDRIPSLSAKLYLLG